MVKTIKITVRNQISVVELSDWSLEEKAKAIGAEYVEIVRTQRMYDLFGDIVVMIVDGMGLVENKPVNLAASYFYGADEHDCMIAGDILLGVERSPDNFPLAHPEAVKRVLMERFPVLWEGSCPDS